MRVRGMGSRNKIHLTGSTGVHSLFVNRKKYVLEISKLMLPHCFKKKDELALVVNYLEDRVTGNEVLLTFNKRTLLGYRKGKVHRLTIPYLHSEGVAKAMRENAAKGAKARTVISPEEGTEIRAKLASKQLSRTALAREYGVSVTAIRNSLRR